MNAKKTTFISIANAIRRFANAIRHPDAVRMNLCAVKMHGETARYQAYAKQMIGGIARYQVCATKMWRRIAKYQACAARMSATLLMIGAVIVMSGCSERKATKENTLMTSVAPLQYMVEKVAGNGWAVEPLVPQGYSPEDYSPTADRMAMLSEARMVFIAGNLPVETTWIRRVVGEVKSLRSVDTSRGLNKEAFDPHTWLSPRNAKMIYRNIRDAMCRIDSANARLYTQRYNEAVKDASSLDNEIQEILKHAPSRTFVIVHPALTEFAKDYNLKQLAIEKDGKEPTPLSLKALIQEAKKDGARVVLLQKEFTETSAQVVARQINAKVIEIDPLSHSWPAQMIHIANAIADQ